MDLIIAAVIVGISVIFGSTILGKYLLSRSNNNEIGIYQMIKLDEKNIIVLDTRTGQYWSKPVVENSSIKAKESARYA
ncbi:hypothetical protein [Clostridium saccharoperbutylacetonicum]|uniref:hypothetical protein n=1 Tax=Clostridium saccharoperbutylacetonicum TaxID=36745 RepID=UPI0039ECC545